MVLGFRRVKEMFLEYLRMNMIPSNDINNSNLRLYAILTILKAIETISYDFLSLKVEIISLK